MMRVFISWSGKNSLSHEVALLLRDWIPKVIQRAECFVSSHDIEAGSLWLNDIMENLATSKVAIVCLTRSNVDKRWLHFEAGAIGAKLDVGYVCPLLINLKESDVSFPLSSF